MSVTRGGNHAVIVTEEDEAAMVEQLLARFGAQLATDAGLSSCTPRTCRYVLSSGPRSSARCAHSVWNSAGRRPST